MNKLFTFGLAALAFAACSNEEDGPAGENGQKGQIIDEISVKFVNATTRADAPDMPGVGSENAVYVTYVFAREEAPSHANANVGDWTVQRVTNASVEAKTDAEIYVSKTKIEDAGLAKMATFKKVTTGDSVYVIVNDPNLDMEVATGLAHARENSEARIKAYVSAVDKTYLNSLVLKNDGLNAEPTNRFTMAGSAVIASTPPAANGVKEIPVEVELNREVAKIQYTGLITSDPLYEAYKSIEFQAGDGIVLARIARNVSFFTTQPSSWYFPTGVVDASAKDWGAAWKTVFDGLNKTKDDTDVAVDATNAGFNTLPAAEAAKEYRLTWVGEANTVTTRSMLLDNGTLYAPTIYVTPNYAKTPACATVICTQATYVGIPVFANADAQNVLTSSYNLYAAVGDDFKDAEHVIIPINKLKWTKELFGKASAYLQETTNADAILAKAKIKNPTLDATLVAAAIELIKGVTEINVAHANLSIYQGMKRYYRADVANYVPDNDGKSISQLITARNTYYQTKATITSLGSESIEGAIDSNNPDMVVVVKVMPWTVKINEINI